MFQIRLKELRENKGLSQYAFAKEIGFSQSTIGNWESGSRQPNMNILKKLAEYFDVSVDYLIGGESASPLTASESRHFCIKLKELRENRGLSQAAFAAEIGVGQSTVGSWENGARKPNVDTMKKLANYFNIPVAVLLDEEPAQKDSINHSRRRGIRIPVYGEVAAGVPIETIENFDSENPDDWEEISEDMARGGDFFALRIHGDSMEPKISNGDIVIVRLQPDVENGETAIVKVNGDTATCKKIKKTPQGLMLISTNPDYEPMFYSKQEVAELPVVIIGKVVELRAKF